MADRKITCAFKSCEKYCFPKKKTLLVMRLGYYTIGTTMNDSPVPFSFTDHEIHCQFPHVML